MAERQHSEAELPPLKIDETERIIARLAQVVRDRRVVLVGGQAVAIWASKLEDRIANALLDREGHERRMDVMASVYGMNAEDIRQTAIEAELVIDGLPSEMLIALHAMDQVTI